MFFKKKGEFQFPLFFIPILAFFVLFTFIPTYERDALLYHLAVPKVWLRDFYNLKNFSHFFFYPSLPFLFNYVALYLSMPFLANLFHLFFAIATVYLIYKTVDEKHSANFISLVFITIQPFLRFSYVAYSDFYLTFFSFSALIFAIKSYELNNRYLLILSAVICGMGLNTKYNMLVFAVLLYFFVFWLCYDKFKSVKKSVADLSLYIFVSFSMFLPFLLKNYFLTSSPFYPFFTNVFPNKNPFAFENVSHFVFRKYFFSESLFQILLTPVFVFFYGVENNLQFFDGVLNPFFVIMPVIAVFAMRDKKIFVLFLFGWLYNYFVLFLEPVSARFLLPSVPIFAYISGKYLSTLRLSQKKLLLIFLPFIIFNLYFGGKHIIDKDKWQYLLGYISKDDFLTRKCPDYPSIKFINEHTPKDAKIFYLFSGQRTYYLERDFIYDSFNDGRLFKRIFDGAKDEKEFAENFKAYGITHIFMRKDLFENFLSDNFSSEELEIIGRFLKNHVKLLFHDKEFFVLEIL
jgi:hypothetical protein